MRSSQFTQFTAALALLIAACLPHALAAEPVAPAPATAAASAPASAAAPAPATAAATAPTNPAYDAALATKVAADDMGMRKYVLVILKTGPNPLPKGPERDAMFRGHFANMKRLSDEGKLVMAGPLDGVDGWRGLFVFAVPDVEQARALAATDPVLAQGEMVAEYHAFYSTAALMLIPELYPKVARKPM